MTATPLHRNSGNSGLHRFVLTPFCAWQFRCNVTPLHRYTVIFRCKTYCYTVTPLCFGVSVTPLHRYTVMFRCKFYTVTPLHRFTVRLWEVALLAEIGQQAWAMTQIKSFRPPGFLVPQNIKSDTLRHSLGGWAGYEPRPVS